MNRKIKVSMSAFSYLVSQIPALIILLIKALSIESLTISDLDVLVLVNVYQCIFIVAMALIRGWKKNLGLVFFTLSFFSLCLGTYLFNLGNENYYGKIVFYTTSFISRRSEGLGLIYFYISLFCIAFSYFSRNQNRELENNASTVENEQFDYSIRRISLGIMVFGLIFRSINLMADVYRFLVFGYRSTYLGVSVLNGTLGTLIDLFDGLYTIGFYSYMATIPPIKKARPYLIIYFILAIAQLMTGTRGSFVTSFLLVIWIFAKYDEVSGEKIILTRRRVVILFIVSFFAIGFLYNYAYLRRGDARASINALESFRNFFQQQGGSGRLVALGIQNQDEVYNYSAPLPLFFAPILNYIKRNAIVRLFVQTSSAQTIENLYRYPNFSWIITYITNPASYTSGGGLGSCYIAEAILGGGPILLVVYNLMVGNILTRLDNIRKNKWKRNYFLITIFSSIIYIPRSTALGIFPALILPLLYVMFVEKILLRKR